MNILNNVLFVGTISGGECGEYACNRQVIIALNEAKVFCGAVDTNLAGDELGGIGKFSITKVFKMIYIYYLYGRYFFSAHLIYFTPGYSRLGMLRFLPMVLLAGLFSKKVVFHYHGSGIFQTYNSVSCIEQFLIKNMLAKVTGHIFLTCTLERKFYENFGVCYGAVVTNFVDSKLVEFLRTNDKKPIVKGQPLKVIFLSNLIKEKGYRDAIEACCILNEKKIAVRLVLVGACIEEDTDWLSFFLLKYQDRICYPGLLEGESKYQCLLDADIFLFPSYYSQEGLPLVILEAMASGCLILTTDIGGITDVVKDGFNGVLLENHTSKCIVKSIITIRDDIEGIYAMSRQAKADSRHFTQVKFKRHILNFLTTCS